MNRNTKREWFVQTQMVQVCIMKLERQGTEFLEYEEWALHSYSSQHSLPSSIHRHDGRYDESKLLQCCIKTSTFEDRQMNLLCLCKVMTDTEIQAIEEIDNVCHLLMHANTVWQVDNEEGISVYTAHLHRCFFLVLSI